MLTESTKMTHAEEGEKIGLARNPGSQELILTTRRRNS
jgi:hypothetical protein